ncbi:MAG: CHAT domain-containing protein [Prochlorothrix sp.]
MRPLLSCLVLSLLGLGMPPVVAVAAENSTSVAALDSIRGDIASEGAISQAFLVQGVELYQAGNFARAAQVWQQAADQLAGDPVGQATALTHLSLAQRQLGQWDQAQISLDRSLTLLQGLPTHEAQQFTLAKTLNAQGSLDLVTGHLNQALYHFQQAALLYGQLGDDTGQFQSQMNWAKVLQAQGRNTLAKRQLEELAAAIQQTPDSALKAATLRQLGEVVKLTTSLEQGEKWLQESLRVAESIDSPTERSATLLSLGLLAQTQNNASQALEYYRSAANLAPFPVVRLQALTSAFEILMESSQPGQSGRSRGEQSQNWSSAVVQQEIEQVLGQAPPNRTVLFAQVHYAQTLLKAPIEVAPGKIAEILADVVQKARVVADPQAESYGLGRLAQVYEQSERWSEAQALTEEALRVAERVNMPEIAYQWQWQLGRILRAEGQLEGAEVAYETAIGILQDLRGDLASLNPEARFSFREEIEPIYRQYVSLLLTPRSASPAVTLPPADSGDLVSALVSPGVVSFNLGSPSLGSPSSFLSSFNSLAKALDFPWKSSMTAQGTDLAAEFRSHSPKLKLGNLSPGFGGVDHGVGLAPGALEAVVGQRSGESGELSQEKLDKARQVIESLQLAELVNFFQADCVTVEAIDADQIDPKAGVIYTILLEDRLEILLSQPNRPIFHKSVAVSNDRIEFVAQMLQRRLRRQEGGFRPLTQALYDWLIRPIEAELAQRDIETLVFVLDGELRNIPMAVLFDGEEYLLEKYALGLTPGLQLFDPKPLKEQPLTALIGALSEARQDFTPLPAVPQEVETINQFLPTTLLMNESFQKGAVAKQITQNPAPIVHFATHGQFSSNAEDTFILTWDGQININEFSELLQGGFLGDDQAIELLVFSNYSGVYEVSRVSALRSESEAAQTIPIQDFQSLKPAFFRDPLNGYGL